MTRKRKDWRDKIMTLQDPRIIRVPRSTLTKEQRESQEALDRFWDGFEKTCNTPREPIMPVLPAKEKI